MKSLKSATFNASMSFLRQFTDVKAIDNPVGRKKHFGLVRIRVDPLRHKNEPHTSEAELLENAKRIRELSTQTARVVHKNDAEVLVIRCRRIEETSQTCSLVARAADRLVEIDVVVEHIPGMAVCELAALTDLIIYGKGVLLVSRIPCIDGAAEVSHLRPSRLKALEPEHSNTVLVDLPLFDSEYSKNSRTIAGTITFSIQLLNSGSSDASPGSATLPDRPDLLSASLLVQWGTFAVDVSREQFDQVGSGMQWYELCASASIRGRYVTRMCWLE